MVTTGSPITIEEIKAPLAPADAFECFKNLPYPFFLDSGMDPQKLGRFSFIGADPSFILKSSGGAATRISRSGETTAEQGSPLDVLGKYLDTCKIAPSPSPVPFTGGAVGFISYDIGQFIEKLPSRAVDDLHLPEMCFGFYDTVLAFDNLLGKAYIISIGALSQDGKITASGAAERINKFKDILRNISPENRLPAKSTAKRGNKLNLKCNFTRESYIAAVEKARQYIIDGDIFEVNLSQRFVADLSIPPWELYLRLRRINPAPFAAYLDFGDAVIVSASPERFLRLTGDLAETRPIKGTIRRGKTADEDRTNAQKLLSSAKDRAENMMIVDLERNDLGRVCRFGSVKVTELAILETYPTVYHLTSTVVGKLRADMGRMELLKATLPGGSITGAPKIRAMEIIDELEPTRRSIYTGNIGYLGFNGDLDLNIAIRTFIIKDKHAYFQAGGAVVYDSNPEAEYQETLDKVRALMDALAG